MKLLLKLIPLVLTSAFALSLLNSSIAHAELVQIPTGRGEQASRYIGKWLKTQKQP